MKETIKEILKNTIFKGESLEIKSNVKPTHGSCCTCQDCGYHYDDCNCSARESVRILNLATDKIQSLFNSLVPKRRKFDWHIEGCPRDRECSCYSAKENFNQCVNIIEKGFNEEI